MIDATVDAFLRADERGRRIQPRGPAAVAVELSPSQFPLLGVLAPDDQPQAQTAPLADRPIGATGSHVPHQSPDHACATSMLCDYDKNDAKHSEAVAHTLQWADEAAEHGTIPALWTGCRP